MAKRKLDILLESAPAKGTNIKYRLSPQKLKALDRDMRELVAAEKKGRVLPSHRQIAEYVTAEYGAAVDEATTRRWLNKIRRGGSIT